MKMYCKSIVCQVNEEAGGEEEVSEFTQVVSGKTNVRFWIPKQLRLLPQTMSVCSPGWGCEHVESSLGTAGNVGFIGQDVSTLTTD